MTEAMPFLQKAILLSYAPRSFLVWLFFLQRTVETDMLKFTRPSAHAPYRPPGRRRVCAVQAFSPRRKPWRRADSLRPSILISQGIQKNNHTFRCGCFFGASDEARTRYLHLGKVALYQMSYTRNSRVYNSRFSPRCQPLFLISSTFFSPAHSCPSSAKNSGTSSRGRYQ